MLSEGKLVTITHRPFKELVVMEYTQYPKPEILAMNLSLSVHAGQAAAMFWAEGVVFIPAAMQPDTDAIVKEYLEGRIIWSSVVFALMPTYQQAIKVGALEIPLIDVTPSPILQQVAVWLRERAKTR